MCIKRIFNAIFNLAMKAILVSKKFNPGHASTMQANAKLLESKGFEVRFNVHQNLLSYLHGSIETKEANFYSSLALRKGDLFIVWFPSLSAFFHLVFVKNFTMATTVYVYHEPYTSFSSYRDAGFSVLKTIRVTAVAIVSQVICFLSDKIMLPSASAFNAVRDANCNPKRYAKINLMFADESTELTKSGSRDFVAYIGTIAEDHAFDQFVRLMHITILRHKLQPLKFLIATRSQIPSKFHSVIGQCIASGRLVLQSGMPMSNEEINIFYSKSFVVWNAYRRSMQSGVLPKAYMFGTPVLISSSNQSEFFKDRIHGVLISNLYSVDEFELAITFLNSAWSVISQNCRSYYLKNFDYRALSHAFINFVSY